MAAVVSVSVLGRSFEVGCDEGQEDTVRRRAADVDRRASEVLRSVGSVDTNKLLVLVSLLLADELAEAKASQDRVDGDDGASDAALASGIEALAKRLDAIAERLEHA